MYCLLLRSFISVSCCLYLHFVSLCDLVSFLYVVSFGCVYCFFVFPHASLCFCYFRLCCALFFLFVSVFCALFLFDVLCVLCMFFPSLFIYLCLSVFVYFCLSCFLSLCLSFVLSFLLSFLKLLC